MTARDPLPVPGRPAWQELRDLAEAARARNEFDNLGDWDHGDISDAITAVTQAGWPFLRAAAEVLRMLGDPRERPANLRAAVQRDAREASVRPATREVRQELLAAVAADCAAADDRRKRATGPLPRLDENAGG